MIKIFRGGKGWWMGWGGSSERCLKWGGGGWGSLRDLSKNILNRGWVKAKVVRRGGVEGVTTPVTTPVPPRKILIIHLPTTSKLGDFLFLSIRHILEEF